MDLSRAPVHGDAVLAMGQRDRYPAGVPCWVETVQPDPQAATRFYGALFGWDVAGPGRMAGSPEGRYFVAQVDGRDVAGIGTMPAAETGGSVAWLTYVRVDDVDEAARRALDAGARPLAAPFDASPAGRGAVLADPAGAPFGVWEAGSREGAQLVDEPRAWALSLLRTPDVDRATSFYGSVFGWRPEPLGGMTIFRLPGYVGGQPQQPVPRDVVAVATPLEGHTHPGMEGPHWSVDFFVADVDATAARATELGGVVLEPPHDTPGFRSALLADPHGAVFSVSAQTAESR